MCSTNNFFTNIVIKSSRMGAIWRPCSIRGGRGKLLFARLCACQLFLAFSLKQITSSNPPSQIWGSMKFGVRSLALSCLLRWIWCYPVFTLWNIACSPRTFECMRVWYLATHHGNYTRGVFVLVDDNDSKVLVTEPQISVQICTGGFSTIIRLRLNAKIVNKHKSWQTAA